MITRRSIALAIASVVLLGPVTQAVAEVAAETDAFGNYLKMSLFATASMKKLRIWTVLHQKFPYFPLNPEGDLNGDQWPVIAENPRDRNRPWVIWSRFNGFEYDLAWARWQPGGWTPIAWLEQSPTPGDDLGPYLALDRDGRPHVTWWRNEYGVGRVYLSIFLATQWMFPYPVSDEGVDSQDPTITVLDECRIQIDYDTPGGRVTRIVHFARPATITDDINPFNRLSVSEASPVTDASLDR